MLSGGDDPLGRTVSVAGADRRVVGVVANARQSSLEVSPNPEVYLPMAFTGLLMPPASYSHCLTAIACCVRC
jgi:hypothetical protein